MNDLAPLRRLPRALTGALAPVAAAAADEGIRVALVGGIVRDRLRRGPPGQDVDLVVEGDALALARRIGGAPGNATVGLRLHDRFGTATLEAAGGWRIDLAGARRETYRRPGALPDVSPATIEEDLARRDFTVNAMAWELPRTASGRPRFHDPFGGFGDLEAKRLRILHDRSFEDDPTRALRAVRYANRLGLRVERATRRRLDDALGGGAFETVSGDRIRRELERTFAEPGAAGALRIASSLGVLEALDPDWIPTRTRLASVARAESLARRTGADPKTRWMIPLLVSTADFGGPQRARLADRLSLAGESRRSLERFRPSATARLSRPEERPSPRPPGEAVEERIAWAALLPSGRARSEAERRLLRPPAALSIRGADLLGAGIPPGPRVGRALAATARARDEGKIGRRDELAFALAAARGEDA